MALPETANPGENVGRARPYVVRALDFLVPAAPFVAATLHMRPTSDATHDEAIVRVLGLGSTGIWRGLDALVALPALALPWSTRLHRAEMTSALGAALAAAILYRLTRDLLQRCAVTTWLGPFVAAITTWAAVLGVAWQTEAVSPGGSTWGALLPFVFVLLLAEERVQNTSFAIGGLAIGLALSYEPLAGVAALVAAAAHLAVSRTKPSPRALLFAGGAAVVGVAAPIAFEASRRNLSTFALPVPSWTSGFLGTGEGPSRGDLVGFAHAELGWVALFAAAAGVVLAVIVPRARPTAMAMVAMTLVLAAAVLVGAPAGPDRYVATSLGFVAAAFVLAAVGMQAAVRAVARANVPFAQASAAMIVVLELTFPAIAMDESSLRAIDRKNRLGARWDDEALAGLPSGALVVPFDARVTLHLLAARAAETLRPDLTVLGFADVGGPAMLSALANDPKLAPVVRDLALTGAATELSLATLADARPLYVQYDPRWDKSLARHLVPGGVFDVFLPEPHGMTDRKRALDAFLPLRQKLEKDVATPRDPETTAITASLLRSRLDALAAIDEKEVLPRAIDDVRAFAPEDPTANRLVVKLVAARVAGSPK